MNFVFLVLIFLPLRVPYHLSDVGNHLEKRISVSGQSEEFSAPSDATLVRTYYYDKLIFCPRSS